MENDQSGVWFSVEVARQWVRAVVLQGERMLRASERMNDIKSMDGFRNAKDVLSIEEHFFVIAVNRAVQWCLEAERNDEPLRGVSKPFRNAADKGKEVRDMREHDIEYFRGGGKKRHRFEADVKISGSLTGRADASSTIVTDQGYLIGGRLNAQEVMDEAQKLYPQLLNRSTSLMQSSE